MRDNLTIRYERIYMLRFIIIARFRIKSTNERKWQKMIVAATCRAHCYASIVESRRDVRLGFSRNRG